MAASPQQTGCSHTEYSAAAGFASPEYTDERKEPAMSLLPRNPVLVPVLLCFSALAGSSAVRAAAPRQPNIVVVLADDLGCGDLGCYNKASKIATPNLDRLAEQGMRFTDAHSPSAVCTPTRYGLLTGRYAWRTRLQRGVLIPYDPPLIATGMSTVPDLLKRHGYMTACIGKWHLGWEWPKPGPDGKREFTGP